MHIKNIHIVNYKGIEDLTVDFGSGVNLIIGNNGAGKSSQKENEKSSTEQNNYEAIEIMKNLVNDKNSRLPLLSYQSDERQFFSMVKNVNRPSGQIERRQGYKNCMTGKASVADIQDWCAQMDYAGYRLGHKAVEYILFKKNSFQFR